MLRVFAIRAVLQDDAVPLFRCTSIASGDEQYTRALSATSPLVQWTTNRDGISVQFNHPFFQAACMFLGEFACLVVYAITVARARSSGKEVAQSGGKKGFNPLILVLPAMCDLLATSTMYVGLGLTDASIFQMLRGSVVVFTGIFSVVFLKRKLRMHHWVGMALVVVGTGIVGSQSLVCSSGITANSNAWIGNILIIVAQLVVATQMVVEEKFLGQYDLPALKVVGLEGLFGFLMLSVLLVVMYFVPSPQFLCDGTTPGQDCSRFEDTYDAFVNMKNSWKVTIFLYVEVVVAWADSAIGGTIYYTAPTFRVASLLRQRLHLPNAPTTACRRFGNIVSIAFFNFLGVSITKHINASTRMVLDSLRTMVIWVVSLALSWEDFCYIEIIGFIVLIAGTIMYNALIKVRYCRSACDPHHHCCFARPGHFTMPLPACRSLASPTTTHPLRKTRSASWKATISSATT